MFRQSTGIVNHVDCEENKRGFPDKGQLFNVKLHEKNAGGTKKYSKGLIC